MKFRIRYASNDNLWLEYRPNVPYGAQWKIVKTGFGQVHCFRTTDEARSAAETLTREHEYGDIIEEFEL